MYSRPIMQEEKEKFRNQAHITTLNPEALELRKRIIGVAEKAGRAHIGPALSVIDIIHVLYREILDRNKILQKLDSRDRFILSKGHGCLGLYAVLEKFKMLGIETLDDFCKYESGLGGHPETRCLEYLEFSTGSLGHGLPVGIGMAFAMKLKNLKSKVIVLIGDGESNEGSTWEGALHASKHQLDNLWVVVDYNDMQASGNLSEVLPLEPLEEKWKAFGFETITINGHSEQEVANVFKNIVSKKPKCIIAHTIKGKGIPIAEDSPEWHHKAKISQLEITNIRKSMENL